MLFSRYSRLRTLSLPALAFSFWSVPSIIPLLELQFDTQTLQTAKDVSDSQDKLIELFNRIEYFFRRLEIYTGIPPTTTMTEMIVEIMVKVITILGIATREMQRGRLSELISIRFSILDLHISREVFEEACGKHGD